MTFKDVEELRILTEAEEICDEIWDEVIGWDYFVRDTVGKQIVKAADSIGSNIAESQGRFHPSDVINFLYYARGSLKETSFWLRRVKRRKLMSEAKCNQIMERITNLAPQLNAFIQSQRKRKSQQTNKPTN